MWLLFAIVLGNGLLLLAAWLLSILLAYSLPSALVVVGWLYFAVYPLGVELMRLKGMPVLSAGLRERSWLGRRLEKDLQFRTALGTADKSLDLPADTGCIVAIHPHGIMSFSQMCCFMFVPSSATVFGSLPMHAVPLVSTELLAVPLLGDLALWLGGQPAERDRLVELLAAKQTVVMTPGGAREIGLAVENTGKQIVTYRRDGFLKQAFAQKAAVLPCLSLGEHSAYSTYPSPVPALQAMSQRLVGHGFPVLALGARGSFWPRAGAAIKLVALQPLVPTAFDTPELFAEAYYQALAAGAKAEGVELVLK